jgi:hypothetical protein
MVSPASEVTDEGGNRARCHFSHPVVITVVHGATMTKLTEVRDWFVPSQHLSFLSEVD